MAGRAQLHARRVLEGGLLRGTRLRRRAGPRAQHPGALVCRLAGAAEEGTEPRAEGDSQRRDSNDGNGCANTAADRAATAATARASGR